MLGCEELFNNIPIKGKPPKPGPPKQIVTGLQGSLGSTIGPDGNLYVTENAAGRISKIDPKTGNVMPFASGLPPMNPAVGIGGVMDVVFLDGTAYALISLVSSDVGGSDVDGVYRIDGPNSFTVIADIGAYNLANPPTGFDFFVKTGVLYAIQAYQDGFLVTDGHLNRVLQVTLDGKITDFKSFGDIVPTGLTVHDNTVYLAEAGPVPHLPENGKVVSFNQN